jgi:hypothetical protein
VPSVTTCYCYYLLLLRGSRSRCPLLTAGGADRDRTDDLLNANQALSQLSYSPSGTFLPLSICCFYLLLLLLIQDRFEADWTRYPARLAPGTEITRIDSSGELRGVPRIQLPVAGHRFLCFGFQSPSPLEWNGCRRSLAKPASCEALSC